MQMRKKKYFVGCLAGVAAALIVYSLYSPFSAFIDACSLRLRLQRSLASFQQDDTKEGYTLAVEDLGGSHSYFSCRADKKFAAASLIKIPLMVAALYAVSEGRVSLADEFVLNKKDVTGGSGVLKRGRFPKKITFRRLLELMISVSDNTAANKIIDIVGMPYINDIFRRLDLLQTSLNRKIMDFSSRARGVENYTSCRDLLFLFRKIYSHDMINVGYSHLMLSFLLEQKVQDRIPKYLPPGTLIAHKTGLEKTIVGDAGIVFGECRDYGLCVAVSQFSSYTEAKDFIARISAVVYNTFNEFFSRR